MREGRRQYWMWAMVAAQLVAACDSDAKDDSKAPVGVEEDGTDRPDGDPDGEDLPIDGEPGELEPDPVSCEPPEGARSIHVIEDGGHLRAIRKVGDAFLAAVDESLWRIPTGEGEVTELARNERGFTRGVQLWDDQDGVIVRRVRWLEALDEVVTWSKVAYAEGATTELSLGDPGDVIAFDAETDTFTGAVRDALAQTEQLVRVQIGSTDVVPLTEPSPIGFLRPHLVVGDRIITQGFRKVGNSADSPAGDERAYVLEPTATAYTELSLDPVPTALVTASSEHLYYQVDTEDRRSVLYRAPVGGGEGSLLRGADDLFAAIPFGDTVIGLSSNDDYTKSTVVRIVDDQVENLAELPSDGPCDSALLAADDANLYFMTVQQGSNEERVEIWSMKQ